MLSNILESASNFDAGIFIQAFINNHDGQIHNRPEDHIDTGMLVGVTDMESPTL